MRRLPSTSSKPSQDDRARGRCGSSSAVRASSVKRSLTRRPQAARRYPPTFSDPYFLEFLGLRDAYLVVTDSKVERSFVTELDTSEEVVVYTKLPRGFFIPTPVGDYNPDWAIAFKEGTVKHVYFVAETKGALSSLQLKGIENAKIECISTIAENFVSPPHLPLRVRQSSDAGGRK